MSNGPFGFECGQKMESFSSSLREIAPFKFSISEVPKPHSAFDQYIGVITPTHGLTWLKAIGKTIVTNPFGVEVRSSFESMKEKLGKIYEKYDLMDFLMHDSIWNEPRDWMQALQKGERVLMAQWTLKHGSRMKDSLVSVALIACAIDTDEGFIVVEYEFENNVLAEAEIAAMEDDVL